MMSILYRETFVGDYYHGDVIRQRSEIKRNLLDLNKRLKEEIIEFKDNLSKMHLTTSQIRLTILHLLEGTLLQIENLNLLTNNHYLNLYQTYQDLEDALISHLQTVETEEIHTLSLSLKEASSAEAYLIGSKAESLRALSAVLPENIPPGFVLTTEAYHIVMGSNDLQRAISSNMVNLDVIKGRELFRERTKKIRKTIEEFHLPEEISDEIETRARKFHEVGLKWAVRSSAVADDSNKTFAGLFDSYFNVPEEELSNAYLRVVASRFSDRAVYYRLSRNISEAEMPLAVLFLPMIDGKTSGVLYTRDPKDVSKDCMLINSVWGLAIDLMKGDGGVDTFIVNRMDGGSVIKRYIGEKLSAYEMGKNNSLEMITLNGGKINAPSLNEKEIAELVRLGIMIEDHFGSPQDVEWVMDKEGKSWILQSRRLMVKEQKKDSRSSFEPAEAQTLLEGGLSIFPGWAEGPVYLLERLDDLQAVPTGAILVVRETNPELIQILPYVAGLIAEQEGHTGRVSAEVQGFGIPCLMGVKGAFDRLKGFKNVIIDAAQRKVYKSISSKTEALLDSESKRGKDLEQSDPIAQLVCKPNISEISPESRKVKSCQSLYDLLTYIDSQTNRFDAVSGKIKDKSG